MKIFYDKEFLNSIDKLIAGFMEHYGYLILRISIAVVFIWFGLLKPFGISPAEGLVRETVYWVDPDIFVPLLGWWEVSIGITLLIRPLIRVAILLLFLQIPGTFLPLILLPDVTFTHIPYGLTTEGQYIVKNLIIIGAALVIGGTVRRKKGETML